MEHTKIEKRRDGWYAITEIELNKFKDPQEGFRECTRLLRISTAKHGGIVKTVASVFVRVPQEGGWNVEKHSIFEDYFKTVKTNSAIKRVTEKAITAEHNEVLKQKELYVTDAKVMYASEVA